MNSGPTVDGRLSDEAHACLQSSPYFSIRKVLCEVQQGVLVLRGRLPSFYQKQVAQASVAHLQGLHKVENRIEVAGAFA